VSGKILVARRIPEAGLRLLEGFDVEVLSKEEPPERDALLAAVRDASGIITTVTEQVDAEVLDAAGGDLRVVANMAVGYDNVDVAAAAERGVVVTNTPGVLDETTADTAFMLLLAAARRLGEAERMVRSGRWRHWGPELLTGPDVWGKTLGIVGMGRIGRAVARRARGFDMQVLYTSRTPKEEVERELGARRVHLDELLSGSSSTPPAARWWTRPRSPPHSPNATSSLPGWMCTRRNLRSIRSYWSWRTSS
jgi:glyoxylate reductase